MENSWNTANQLQNLTLTWSPTWVIINLTGAVAFAIPDTKLYIPVATLSTWDNAKLLQQLKSGSERTINWNIFIKSIQRKTKSILQLLNSSYFSERK